MDQQVMWNDFHLEGPSLEEYLTDPLIIPYANVTSEENASSSMWNLGAPSSSENPQNQGNRDEPKMEIAWATSRAGTRDDGLRIGERRTTLDLNSCHMDNSHSNNLPQDLNHNVGHIGTSSQAPKAEHVLSSGGSSSTYGNSSRGVRINTENVDGRPGGSLDGRRACKRKNIEGVPEQESASGSSSFFRQGENSSMHSIYSHHNPNTTLNISRSSGFLPSPSPAQLNSSSVSVPGNAESLQRNVRMRINPAYEHGTAPPRAQQNTATLSNAWLTNQSSPPTPFNQSLNSRPLVVGASPQSAFNIPVISQLPRNSQSWSGASSTRIGSSPSNPIIVGDRMMAAREGTSSRSIPRSSTSDLSAFGSMPLRPSRALRASNPGSATSASPAVASSGVHQPLVPALTAHQNPTTQVQRSFPEIVRRSLISAGSAAFGGQGFGVATQRSTQSAASHDIVRPSVLRGHPQSYLRPALMMDRQIDGGPGGPGVPVSMRTLASTREQRARFLSQMRNVIDLMRRGENWRNEDIAFFDPAFYLGGGADMFDRHRDMRLDVDNMSYEELLALEERIGDVNTGLSEETVEKCLKQQVYVANKLEASAEVEPCCICQQEYVDHDKLGRLDCGHDFHTDCIKQWLLQKNICPICKTTALVTTP